MTCAEAEINQIKADLAEAKRGLNRMREALEEIDRFQGNPKELHGQPYFDFYVYMDWVHSLKLIATSALALEAKPLPKTSPFENIPDRDKIDG